MAFKKWVSTGFPCAEPGENDVAAYGNYLLYCECHPAGALTNTRATRDLSGRLFQKQSIGKQHSH